MQDHGSRGNDQLRAVQGALLPEPAVRFRAAEADRGAPARQCRAVARAEIVVTRRDAAMHHNSRPSLRSSDQAPPPRIRKNTAQARMRIEYSLPRLVQKKPPPLEVT